MIERYIHFHNFERIQSKTGMVSLTVHYSC